MKKIISAALAISLLGGCASIQNSNISGHYRSSCYNLGFPELEVFFSKNGTFTYEYAHNPDRIAGKWEIKKDTLFLYSGMFDSKTISLEELATSIITNPDSNDFPLILNGQYTQTEGKDAYLIKGNKLYRIMGNKHTKNCHLVSVQD